MGGSCSTTISMDNQDLISAKAGKTENTLYVGASTYKHGFLNSKCDPDWKTRKFDNNAGVAKIYKPNPLYNRKFDVFKGEYCGATAGNCGDPNDAENKKFYKGFTNEYDTKTKKWKDPELLNGGSTFMIPQNIAVQDKTDEKNLKCDLMMSDIPSGKTPAHINRVDKLYNFTPLGSPSADTAGPNDDIGRDSNVYIQTIKYPYTGGMFNSTIYAGPDDNTFATSAEKIKKLDAVLSPFTTIDDMYYFNDNVFDYWLNTILSEEYMQVVLDDIRNVINDNVEMVMLNKVNEYSKPMIEKLKGNSMAFVDMPIGPPIITVNSTIIRNEYYYPNVNIKPLDPEYTSYETNLSTVNVINQISPDTKNSSYKPQNYLDQAFTEIVSNTTKSGSYVKDDTYCITIPKVGCQILEVVGTDSRSTGDYAILQNGDEMVYATTMNGVKEDNDEYNTTNAQALAESDVLNNTDTGKESIAAAGSFILPLMLCSFGEMDEMLKTGYDDPLESIGGYANCSIIRYVFDNENGTVNVEFNTLNNDVNNRMYVYVAKSSKCGGHYVSGGEKTSGINGIACKMVNMSYDINNSSETPAFLKNRMFL